MAHHWKLGMRKCIALLAHFAVSQGCTYFEVPQEQGLVVGRSMELGDLVGESRMNWTVVVHPRLSASADKPLGYVSIDGLGWKWLPKNYSSLVTEGMNEKGLSVSANTLRKSVYESHKAAKPIVLWWDVVPYLLENFGTVKEAIDGLRHVAVAGPPDAPETVCGTGACFHWALADATGNSAVVEFLKGKMHVWEGRAEHVGVMTNDPDLDWHMTNLDQYVNLRPDWPGSNDPITQHLKIGNHPGVYGHGFNLHGMPGDGSPASRFVRMFYLREYAMTNYPEAMASKESAITLATGLLNNAYLVKGTIAKSGVLDALEYTPWATIKIPHAGLLMYRTASDMTWKQISLKDVDFLKPNHAFIHLSMEDNGIQDVTNLLSPKQLNSESVV